MSAPPKSHQYHRYDPIPLPLAKCRPAKVPSLIPQEAAILILESVALAELPQVPIPWDQGLWIG